MAEIEQSLKQGQKKGFAGLSSMVSNIDSAIADASKLSPLQSGGSVPPSPIQTAPQSRTCGPTQDGRATSSDSSSNGKWLTLIGLSVFFGIIFLAGTLIDPSSTARTDRSTAAGTANSGVENSSFRPVPPELPTESATSADSSGVAISVTTETGATYSFPIRYAAEIDAAQRAATAAKQVADIAQRELERTSKAIEAGQAEYDTLTARRERLGDALETERRILDDSSEYAINSFNLRVDQYNSLGERLKRMGSQLEADIDDYNRRVSAVQQKIDQANRLVSIYNGKLEQYGSRRR